MEPILFCINQMLRLLLFYFNEPIFAWSQTTTLKALLQDRPTGKVLSIKELMQLTDLEWNFVAINENLEFFVAWSLSSWKTS